MPVWIRPIPRWRAYQLMLRRAELSTGLPRRISLDHGTVLYENTSPSPFPTPLHLWLLADSALTFASPTSAVPLTTPRPGRTHQTMTRQARHGPTLAGSAGVMGLPGLTPCRARVHLFPVGCCRVKLPDRPIRELLTRVGSHAQHGKSRCSTWLASLGTWRPAAGFGAYGPTGGSTLGAMTTTLAPLGATRCSNSTSMPIRAVSWGNQQAAKSPSPLHKRRLAKTDLMANSATSSPYPSINLPCRLPMRHGASWSIHAS
jgi:hypothetical protein